MGITFEQGMAALETGDLLTVEQHAKEGDPIAQVVLGRVYSQGKVVTQDYSKALHWLGLSAEQGHPMAQWLLGSMYHNAEGVEADFAEARKWYDRAASNGFALAQYQIGYMCKHGEGTVANPSEAIKWYRLAAEQRLADAQYALGIAYARGNEGVETDFARAYVWCALAAASDTIDPDTKSKSIQIRDIAAQMLPANQLSTIKDGLKNISSLSEDKIASIINAAAEGTGNSTSNKSIDTGAARVQTQTTETKSGGCFIATAALGSSYPFEMDTLYRWRDEVLLNSSSGRLFVKIYYFISPSIARCIAQSPIARRFVTKYLIKPWCARLHRKWL